ncbi:MAG TPA: cytochrome P460 family protein [Labilithrix sp.]|jgi:hypothetical protein
MCACGPRDRGPAVGTSDRTPGGAATSSSAAADGGTLSGAGALPAGYRTSFTKVNKARLISTGHASGRWEVDVYANEAAAKALASRAKDVPVGAIVVEEHYEHVEGRPAGPVMIMEKREKGFSADHGDWRYAVIGSTGALVKDGAVDSCAACHDASPMDGLFPIVE